MTERFWADELSILRKILYWRIWVSKDVELSCTLLGRKLLNETFLFLIELCERLIYSQEFNEHLLMFLRLFKNDVTLFSVLCTSTLWWLLELVFCWKKLLRSIKYLYTLAIKLTLHLELLANWICYFPLGFCKTINFFLLKKYFT